MNRKQTIKFLKTQAPASYPSPPGTAEEQPQAAALLRPCSASSRSEGGGGRQISIALALGSATLLFAGCVVGPNYSRPTTVTAATWKEAAATTNAAVLPAEWWTIFNDAELNALEKQAIHANQDLKRAVARVTEARAIARVSKADLYPTISADQAYSNNRASENVASLPGQDQVYNYHSGSFDLNYELDVWGRVRRTIEASKADAAAVAADLEVVLLTLTADVARNYQLLRSLDNERLVIEATIALRKDTLQLQQTRNQAGLINEVDVTRARTELANVEAELHAVNRNRAQVEHALAVLCGEAPANFSVAAKATNVVPPEIPAGLPSSLLQRRPDVVKAEHELVAANAHIGVAKAAFFPTIKLTGATGLASTDLGDFLEWPSRVWSIGPSVHFPIFEGGRNAANLHATEARYEQNVAGYRSSVLNAFREVEDSLSDLSTLASQAEAVNRALVSARDTTSLANERYQQGLTSYLDVVDAQREALKAERLDAQLRGQRAVSTILLAKALGGGWERPDMPMLSAAK